MANIKIGGLPALPPQLTDLVEIEQADGDSGRATVAQILALLPAAPQTERARVLPRAAQFEVVGAAGGSLTDRTYSLDLKMTGANIAMAQQLAALPAAPYSIISRAMPGVNNGNVYQGGLILRNSANSRVIVTGWYQGNDHLIQNWNSLTSYNSNILQTDVLMSAGYPWQKIEVEAGGTIRFYLGPDGESWDQMATTTVANFLGAIDKIGFAVLNAGSRTLQQSYEVI